MLNLAGLCCCLLLQASQIDARNLLNKQTPTRSPAQEVASWKGKWFPHAPDFIRDDIASWKGKWFPHPPRLGFEHNSHDALSDNSSDVHVNTCDDGKNLIGVDYEPSDLVQSYKYLCLSNRTEYAPNMDTEALIIERFIPPAYVPPVKCLNETLSYAEPMPTFGPFRPYGPQYGTYQYLPPQRYLYALAQGAIVMAYHPCAFAGQVQQLQKTLRACLYRHIITPSQALSAKRPLALLAWGKSLEMSVIDESMVVDFIKRNAKRGPIAGWDLAKETKTYKAGLLSEAHLVTDINDGEVCGYIGM